MLGKTRQQPEHCEAFDPELGKARGVLRAPAPPGNFRHVRRSPAPESTRWIDHYWMVAWDLRGYEPHRQETLPHPNFHLVFEEGAATIAGVFTGKFSRMLEGQSHAFGVKFRPGGFRAFLKRPASSLLNRTVAANGIFGGDVDELATRISACAEDQKMEAANAFFIARKPEFDETIALASGIVARILTEPGIKTVDDLVGRTGIGKRSLQRIFRDYVGVNPKWVIRRYRLHELVERFHSAEPPDWAQLALDLGYFDQAHLINDFRSVVGYTPTGYHKLVAQT